MSPLPESFFWLLTALEGHVYILLVLDFDEVGATSLGLADLAERAVLFFAFFAPSSFSLALHAS